MENTKADVKTIEGISKEADAKAIEGISTEADMKTNEGVNREMSMEVILQYRGYEVNMDDVTERVKAHYVAKGNSPESIENMQIYVKPEDFTAYFVINDGGVVGKVNLF